MARGWELGGSLALGAWILVGPVGCKDAVYSASLEIDPASTAGDVVPFRLAVEDEEGVDVSAEARLLALEVVPSEGVGQTASTLTFTVATVHRLRAVVEIDGQSLEARAELDVRPAQPARVALAASSLTPQAGERVTLTPSLLDAYGNGTLPPGSFRLAVDPATGASLGVDDVTFTRAGPYTVSATELGTGWIATQALEVGLGEVMRVRLEADDNRLSPGQSLTATLYGIDGFGNEAPISGALRVDPTTGVALNGDSIRFSQEGLFTVTGTYEGFSASLEVIVDGTPPSLEVTEPARASFVTTSPVSFSGLISDNLAGIKSLTINGDSIRIQGTGFTHSFEPIPGTNIVTLDAIDLNENRTVWTQSFIWAPAWTAPGEPSPGGLYGRLNRGTIDILTELLEDELDAESIEEDLLAENPLATYDDNGITAVVTLEAFTYDDVVGLLQPHADGGAGYLEIEATFYDMYARLRAKGKTWLGSYDMTGELSATSGTARGHAYASIHEGAPEVTIDPASVDVSFSDFDVTFSGDVLNAVGEILEQDIQDAIEDELEALILDEIPPFLVDSLNYLNYSTTIEVDLGDVSTLLTIVTELESIRMDDAGLTLGETTRVSAPIDERMPSNPGVPRVGAADLKYDGSPGYLLSASLDALNTLLHSLWNSGILTYQYTVVADTGQTFTAAVDLPLPPLIQPATDPEYVIDASAGDILLELYLNPEDLEPTYVLAVSLIVPATAQSGEGGTTISILFGEPVITYQVIVAPARGLDASALGALVSELVTELLNEAETYTTDIILPEFEGYQLTISEVSIYGSDWGYLTVGGDLE